MKWLAGNYFVDSGRIILLSAVRLVAHLKNQIRGLGYKMLGMTLQNITTKMLKVENMVT